MKLKYLLDSDSGWARLIVEDEGVSLDYRISYCLGNELTELLGGLAEFVGSPISLSSTRSIFDDLKIGDGAFEWSIDEEGRMVDFIFSKTEDEKTVNLEITEDEMIVYNRGVDLKDLLKDLLSSCSDLLRKYGIIGYSLNFWKEFPVSYYLILKDYIEDAIKIDRSTEVIDDMEQEMYRSDFNEEIKYLKD